MPFGLSEERYFKIKGVFKRFSFVDEVLIFGSRAMDTYKEASDIDLAIIGQNIKQEDILKIAATLDELPYGYTYDVIDYNKISNPIFKEHIDKFGIQYYKRGTVPQYWITFKLKDAVEQLIDYRGKTPPKTDKGIPLITAKIIKNGRIENPTEFIDNKFYEEWMRRGLPKYGDVVLTTEAPLGEVAQIRTKEKIALAQRVIALRGKKNIIDSTFLKYYLQSPIGQHNLKSKGTGSTVTGIKQSELREIEIIVPDFNSQIQIGSILSSLDDKIELNLQINQTLEAIAQAVFKKWFDSQEKVFLVDYVQLNPSISIKKNTLAKYVEMASLPQSGFSISSFTEKPFSSGSKFQNFDTLLARITPCLENGKTGFVDFLANDEIAFGSTEFMVMRARNTISPYYVYFQARDNNFREYAIKSMIGTSGRQRVQTDMLNSYVVSKVDKKKMVEFDIIAGEVFKKIKTNSDENQTLTQLRNNLLPRLMSGKFKI